MNARLEGVSLILSACGISFEVRDFFLSWWL
jgi:hypothetical protein